MKILHAVEFYYPSVGGAQEVVKQLSEHLVMLGHDVTVVTTKLPNRKKKVINGVKIIEFDISGNQVRGYRGNANSYKEYLSNSKFDVVMNYAAQQWTTDLFFEVIDQVSAKKVLVPCGFSGLYDPNYKQYFHDLPGILRKYDYSIYLSGDYRDISFAKKHNIKNREIIPNGADEREFSKLDARSVKRFRSKHKIKNRETLIINVSTHTGVKGHQEAIEAFKKSNIENATLMFIGDINNQSGCYRQCNKQAWVQNSVRALWEKKNKKIKIINIGRKETVLAFQAADIFLFLSNIECSPLVLFEAAAAGKPFITSKCGNSEEIAKWTGAGIACKSTQDKMGYTKVDIPSAVKAIEKLVGDKKLRVKMGISGRKAWKEKYSWEKISGEYEKLYKRILGGNND